MGFHTVGNKSDKQIVDRCKRGDKGRHARTNLYPVLHHLHVPLKYICCTSEEKARLIARCVPWVKATTSLDEILEDKGINGVFVAATPSEHFAIASRVLEGGKSLFIEKPPCESLSQLDALLTLQRQSRAPVAAAGMQKRYAPGITVLRKRIAHEKPIGYSLKYLTGMYPESDELSGLFIHPLDLVTFLFGKAEAACITNIRKNGGTTLFLTLKHKDITGMLELSTHYSWTDAAEQLTVNTLSSTYTVTQTEEVIRTGKSASVFGIPLEKILRSPGTAEYLFRRNGFTPVFSDNPVYVQGFYHEIKTFVDTVEGRRAAPVPSALSSVRDTYILMDKIRSAVADAEPYLF